jgi:hypothetical protein
VVLRWINPPDADFVGVRLRYRTDRFPSGSEDGTLLGDVVGQAGDEGSITHLYLTNGVTYYYSAAAYDANGNQQNTVFASATTFEQTVDGDPEAAGGCGMILPRDGGRPSGPGQAADLLILAMVALLMMGRQRMLSKLLKKSICCVIGRRKASRTNQYAPVFLLPAALQLEFFEQPACFTEFFSILLGLQYDGSERGPVAGRV